MSRRTQSHALPPPIRGGKGKPGAVANMIKGAFLIVIRSHASGRNTNAKVYRIVHVPNPSKYNRVTRRTTKPSRSVQLSTTKKTTRPLSVTRNRTKNNIPKRKRR